MLKLCAYLPFLESASLHIVCSKMFDSDCDSQSVRVDVLYDNFGRAIALNLVK